MNDNNFKKGLVKDHKEYICPETLQPVIEIERFNNVEIGKNYFFNIKKIGDCILFISNKGDLANVDLKKNFELIDEFINEVGINKPYIEIRDMSNLNGRIKKLQLKYQKEYYQKNKDIETLIYCNASAWMRGIALAAFKTFKMGNGFKSVNTYREAVTEALDVLNKNTNENGELSFEDIQLNPEWNLSNPQTDSNYKNGVIPGKVFYSSLSGSISEEELDKLSQKLEKVYQEGNLRNKKYFRIADYSNLKRSSIWVRKKYAQIIKELNQKYNFFPRITYICGANLFTRSALRLFAAFVGQEFVFVNSVEDAFNRINLLLKDTLLTKGEKQISVTQKDVDEIHTLCGTLLLDEFDSDNYDTTISPNNPLYQLKDILSLVKQDLEELRTKDHEQSENWLNIFESIQVGVIIIDKLNYNILFVNRMAAQMAKTTKKEIEGKICHELICPAQKGKCPIIDLGLDIDKSERVMLDSEGNEHPILKSVRPFVYQGKSCLLETFIDISEIRQAREEREIHLQELEEKKRMLIKMMNDNEEANFETLKVNQQLKRITMAVDASSNGIAIASDKGEHFYHNQTFTRMFGYQLEELKTFETSVIFKNKQKAQKVIDILISGKNYDGELEMITKEGLSFPVHLKANAIKDDSGKVIGLIGVHSDITERRIAEKKLKELNKTLKKQTAIAKEANIAKSDFLANMSHEIRTPMNGVIGMTGLLLDTDLTEEQRSYAETVQVSANSLLGLINDILDFSKIEAGKLDLEILDFNLRSLMEDFAEMMALKVQEKDLEFLCEVKPGVTSFIKGDPGRLRQILINLTGNAIKFTREGEIVVRAVLESETEEDVVIQFLVTDTGIGIPDDRKDSLFDQFTQVDTSTTRKYGGTGLGLAISKQLIEAMNGEIGVRSQEGEGSEFWFTAKFQKQSERQTDLVLPSEIRGSRILIVDDNATNREILNLQLKVCDARADEASGGKEALNKIRESVRINDPYHAAVIDMQMPGMSGKMLGKAIKEDELLDEIPLIMMTSIGKRGDAKRFKKIGFAAYLTKPVKQSDFYDCLALVLTKKSIQKEQKLVTRHTIRETKFSSSRILLVEDNPTNQLVTIGLLKKLGLSAEAVANGIEAVKALELIPYDLVLMDVQMPEMDGYEATGRIRDPKSKVLNHDIPIVALTAHAMKGDKEKCLESGMDDYLSKPVLPEDLKEKVKKWLKKQNFVQDQADLPTKNRDLDQKNQKNDIYLFNRAELKQRLMDDEELVQAVIEGFLEDIPKQLEKLKEPLETGDAKKIELYAHGIKGAAANIGSRMISEISGEIEKAGNAGKIDNAKAKMPELISQFERLSKMLDF